MIKSRRIIYLPLNKHFIRSLPLLLRQLYLIEYRPIQWRTQKELGGSNSIEYSEFLELCVHKNDVPALLL